MAEGKALIVAEHVDVAKILNRDQRMRFLPRCNGGEIGNRQRSIWRGLLLCFGDCCGA